MVKICVKIFHFGCENNSQKNIPKKLDKGQEMWYNGWGRYYFVGEICEIFSQAQ